MKLKVKDIAEVFWTDFFRKLGWNWIYIAIPICAIPYYIWKGLGDCAWLSGVIAAWTIIALLNHRMYIDTRELLEETVQKFEKEGEELITHVMRSMGFRRVDDERVMPGRDYIMPGNQTRH